MMELAEDLVEGMVAEVAGDSAVEDLAAGKEEEMVEGMVAEMAEDSAEGTGQPKYFQSYRTNSPDRRCRTCISLGTQSHL